MVEIKNLRVGNLLRISGGDYKVLMIDGQCGIIQLEGIGLINIERVKPILINDDVLKRCNFRFKEFGYDNISISISVSLGFEIDNDIHFVIGTNYFKITYLHDLQNIYLDLIKKELLID
jgi:hypothetical protein